MSFEAAINDLWEAKSSDPTVTKAKEAQDAIKGVLDGLNSGSLRIADPPQAGSDSWTVNAYAKKAVLMYFGIMPMKSISSGDIEYFDKVPLKKNYELAGVRVVPPAVARYGSHLEKGVILMPSYVNIGAYVSSGTMVDTWATVGSCAQIGRDVHLSGGVGIGGVLEPPQADPVIIEDNAFLGSRCVVVEGVRVRKGAVLGSGVILTSSTKIIDVTGNSPIEYKGDVPENSVVIPGSIQKKFNAGEFNVPAALIIGQRKASTDLKTSLNDALRDFEVSV